MITIEIFHHLTCTCFGMSPKHLRKPNFRNFEQGLRKLSKEFGALKLRDKLVLTYFQSTRSVERIIHDRLDFQDKVLSFRDDPLGKVKKLSLHACESLKQHTTNGHQCTRQEKSTNIEVNAISEILLVSADQTSIFHFDTLLMSQAKTVFSRSRHKLFLLLLFNSFFLQFTCFRFRENETT